MSEVDRLLARARRELDAAGLLLDEGYPDVALARAYDAAFHAATGALLALGETRSRHGGVIAAFGEAARRR